MNDALKTIFESAEALNENGLQVLALIAGVIRQVAPSSQAVALPETSPVAPSSVAEPAVELTKAAPVESVEPPVALPETAPLVEPVALPETPVAEPPQAVAEPAYRFVLKVPEIKDYKDVK